MLKCFHAIDNIKLAVGERHVVNAGNRTTDIGRCRCKHLFRNIDTMNLRVGKTAFYQRRVSPFAAASIQNLMRTSTRGKNRLRAAILGEIRVP